MTCEDARAMRKKNPLDCTRAERSAVRYHVPTCPECRAFFEIDEPIKNPLANLIGILVTKFDRESGDLEIE